jgi:hypothetical protein
MAARLAVRVPVPATVICAGVRSSLGKCAIFIFVSLQASGCFTGREGEDSPGHYTIPPQFGNSFAPSCSRLYGASADWVCLSRIKPVCTGFARWATVSRQLR